MALPHIVLEPLDLMAWPPALVASQRVHLTRFYSVFAAHSNLRTAVTPAHRGMGHAMQMPADSAKPTQAAISSVDKPAVSIPHQFSRAGPHPPPTAGTAGPGRLREFRASARWRAPVLRSC